MLSDLTIGVIIPALNEERSIGRVLAALPSAVDRVVVVDNGSTDRTPQVAARHGAQVVHESFRGYGAACLAGITALGDDADVIVFVDGDFSDHPEQLDRLVEPIAAGRADLVIGSRTLGRRERGALNLPQRAGNALACTLIRLFWKQRHTDLGPFRAIRTDALAALRMDDRTFGWTVQMQVRALRAGLRVAEVPVDYRRRIGRSKISGTVSGIARAGTKIIGTIFQERWRPAAVLDWSPRRNHLIVLTRYPTPGRTKTRMIPALGPRGAADLQRQMTLHTLAAADRAQPAEGISCEVRYTGGPRAAVATLFGEERVYRRQPAGDLGRRLARAAGEALARGAGAVVMIGCDCPALDARLLESAFEKLRQADVVIGPARDGGYYLIGLRANRPALFEGVCWGTAAVRRQTLARAARLGLNVTLLPMLNDVDEPPDLPVWHRHRKRLLSRGRVPLVSVIIPTLDEAADVGRAIASAGRSDDVEIIVADGGSRDGTAEIAAHAGAVVVTSPPGRGRQMNAGAAVARGAILLFLHADTTLPPQYLLAIRAALADPGVALTAFRLAITPARPALRFIAATANLRSRWLGLPYGDQALAVRAATFRRLGGFQNWSLLEDFEFVRRVRRTGRLRILKPAVHTSGRRWLARGVLRTTLIHQACVLGYACGIAPDRLAAWRDGTPEPAAAFPPPAAGPESEM